MTTGMGQDVPAFLGQFYASVTGDGRIRLPKGVVRQLKARQVTVLWLCAMPGLKALAMCPDSVWITWVQEAKRRFPCLTTPDGVRTYLSPSTPVIPDRRGRITIPERLCAHADLRAGDVAIVVGMEVHFEIWNRAEFERVIAATEAALRQGASGRN